MEQSLFTRLTYARSLLDQLGAPTVDVVDPRPGLVALGEWLQGWFPAAVAPFVQTSYPSEPGWWPKWIDVRSEDRLGDVSTDWPHQHHSYSELGDTVLHSLVVDMTVVVMDCAQRHGASLGWVVRHEPRNGRFHLVVRPSTPPFAPLEQVRQLLVQSVGPTRGERSRSLRRRQSEFLVECFDQAVTGVVPESTEGQFAENRYRSMSRFVLKRPPRSPAPAPVEVEKAVARLRAIGWYGSWKHSDEELARAVCTAWHLATGRSLPSDPEMVWTCLLLMDSERTWFEDVDVNLRGIGDQLYGSMAFALEGIGGRGFGGFSDPEEDWRSTPGIVEFSVRWRRKLRHFRIPQTSDGLLHPCLSQEINALLPEDGPRLFFLDIGPTVAVVVRLSEEERQQLRALTHLDLLDGPPSWWTLAAEAGLSSLPPQRIDPLLWGDPVSQPEESLTPGPLTADDQELRGVTITDYEDDGHLVFSVFVPAAEFLRQEDLEHALDERITAALRAVGGVTEVTHMDREVWEVLGSPREAELEDGVGVALESIFTDFADEIGNP